MIVKRDGGDLLIGGIGTFSLERTLNCGQCFSFSPTEKGGFCGVVREKVCHVRQEGELLRFFGTDEKTAQLWISYFDLDTDYEMICRRICTDETMKRAVESCAGIRILRQEPWETLCSFILSQNNHIPRIRGIVGRLREMLGKPLGNGHYAFPTPEVLASCTPEDLAPLRSGFRAKYLCDAAKKVAGGQLDFSRIASAEHSAAREELMTVYGVGKKVAECTLLYGFHRLESFPEDVWIRRAMQSLYPEGIPEAWAPYEGVAQQFLFDYVRKTRDFSLHPVIR